MTTALEAYLGQQQANQQTTIGNIQAAGALQGLQANAQKQQREQAYRQELSALGPNPTQEQIVGVTAKYASPDKLMDVQQKSIDKQAASEAARSAAQERLAQQKQLAEDRLAQQTQFATMMHEYRMSSAKTAEERAAETARHNAQLEALQKQNLATNEELKRVALQLQSDKIDQGKQAGLQKQTQQLGTALERANLPEADSVLRGVEDALRKRPDLAEYLSGGKSLLPDAVVDKDIAAGRQAFAKLFNITLKNRSGAAVTVPEFERLKAEFGNGVWKTPEQFKNGIEQARNIISQHYRSVASGFGTDALNAYNSNLREMGGSPLLEPQGTPTTPRPARLATFRHRLRGSG
jgi:hypothetical protein